MKKSLFIVFLICLSFPAAAQSPSDFANQSPYRSGNYGSSYGNQSGGSYNPAPRTPSDYADQHPYRSGNYGDSYGYADSHMRHQQGCVYRRVGYQMYKYCH